MTYTDNITWTNTRVTKNQMNEQVRDNLLALKFPPSASYIASGRLTDYSTTSTSFADVDSTNMDLNIETTGDGAGGNSDIFMGFNGTVYSSGSIRVYFRLLVDTISINADDGLLVSEGTGLRPVSFLFPHSVAAGLHSVKLQWKVSSGTGVLCANAGTSGRDIKAQFFIREMS